MNTPIKINEVSLQILTDMMLKNEDTLFIACAKHIKADLNIQIQESSNLKEISQLQQHFSKVNKMLSHYSIGESGEMIK